MSPEILKIQYSIAIPLWILAVIAWYITYIGAPSESKKSGRHVSGIPGIAFILFLIAGIISPCKWLMLLALMDFSIDILLIDALKFWGTNSNKNETRDVQKK